MWAPRAGHRPVRGGEPRREAHGLAARISGDVAAPQPPATTPMDPGNYTPEDGPASQATMTTRPLHVLGRAIFFFGEKRNDTILRYGEKSQ